MSQSPSYSVPTPRIPVADSRLARPNWTTGTPRDSKLLWLDKNENTDPHLAKVTGAVLSEVSPIALCTYPECGPLYRKLASSLGLAPENLVLAAGSDGVIRSVFEAFVDPGDVVIHTLPTFAMYSVYSRMYGAQVVPMDYEPSHQGPFLAIDKFLDAIRNAKPKLVCLPNPDSPTGTVFFPDALRRVIDTARDAGALMLLDEAYFPFYDETAASWVLEYPNLVVARTFAKAWGLAGLRIGYAITNPEIARLLHKVRPMYEVNTLAVSVVERMLDFRSEMATSVRRLNDGRDRFLAAMEEMEFRTIHAKGNFLHVAFGADGPAIHSALKDLVLYRENSNEPCLPGFTRFSATTLELFQPVIDRIRQTVRERRPERSGHAK